jgi:hypothetical protein
LINTSINIADHLTKPLSSILFHRHAGFLLGQIPLQYSPVHAHAISTYGDTVSDIDWFVPALFTTPITAKAARIFTPTHEDVRGNPWLIVLWHD